jgi:hypothetical protein
MSKFCQPAGGRWHSWRRCQHRQCGRVGTASQVIPWPTNPAYNGVNIGFQVLSLVPGAPLGYTLSTRWMCSCRSEES